MNRRKKPVKLCCSRLMAEGLHYDGYRRRCAYLCGECGRLVDKYGNTIWPAKQEMAELARAVIREVAKC